MDGLLSMYLRTSVTNLAFDAELDEVDGRRIGVDVDDESRGDCDGPAVSQGDRVGQAPSIDDAIEHQAHAGIGCGVVEGAHERVDTHGVAALTAGGEVLRSVPVDGEADAADESHVGVVDAVHGRRADVAVGRRPHLRGCPEHHEGVVQQRLEGCGHSGSRVSIVTWR